MVLGGESTGVLDEPRRYYPLSRCISPWKVSRPAFTNQSRMAASGMGAQERGAEKVIQIVSEGDLCAVR